MSIDSMYQALEAKFGAEDLAQILDNGDEKDQVIQKITKKFFLTAKEIDGKTVVEFKAKPFAWGLVHFFRKLFGMSTKAHTQLKTAIKLLRDEQLPDNEKGRVVRDVVNAIILNTGSGKLLTIKVSRLGTEILGDVDTPPGKDVEPPVEDSGLRDRCKERLDTAMRRTYAPAFESFLPMLEDPDANLEEIYEQIEEVERECKKVNSMIERLNDARSQLNLLPESEERNTLGLVLDLKRADLDDLMKEHRFEECAEIIETCPDAIARARAVAKPVVNEWQEHADGLRSHHENYMKLFSQFEAKPAQVCVGIDALKESLQAIEKGITSENRKDVEKVEKALVQKITNYEKNMLEGHKAALRDNLANAQAQILNRRKGLADTGDESTVEIKDVKKPILSKALEIQQFDDLFKQAADIIKITLPTTLEEAKELVKNFDTVVKEKAQAFEAVYAVGVKRREDIAQVQQAARKKAQNLQALYNEFDKEAQPVIEGFKGDLAEEVVKALKFELQALKALTSEEELQSKISALRTTIGSLEADFNGRAQDVLKEIYPKMRTAQLATLGQEYAKELTTYPFLQALFEEAQKPLVHIDRPAPTQVELRTKKRDPVREALEPHMVAFSNANKFEEAAKAIRARLADIKEFHARILTAIKELPKDYSEEGLRQLVETIKERFPLFLSEEFEAEDLEELTSELEIDIEPDPDRFYDDAKQIQDGYSYLLREGFGLLKAAPALNIILGNIRSSEFFGWDGEEAYKALADEFNPSDPAMKEKIADVLALVDDGLEPGEQKAVKANLQQLLKLVK
ncbi:MAG: hypothetical protein JSR37_07850 [Verrucomicrobia bacterium]|nr:hypothetical protein [Verrucomicrobiota bacterium]MBS0637622.1 hypothetical protein [Verrucomicrobiota bacterium]